MQGDPTVVDATVLNCFAAAERMRDLPVALGGPGAVCRAVWDPDEPAGGDERFRGEINRTSAVHRQRSDERRRSAEGRVRARRLANEYADIERLHARGDLLVVDLDDEERQLAAHLMSPEHTRAINLPFGLAASAAGSVALAISREWEFASDDSDACRTLRAHHPGRFTIGSQTLLAVCA